MLKHGFYWGLQFDHLKLLTYIFYEQATVMYPNMPNEKANKLEVRT